jgi:hypothetical protein
MATYQTYGWISELGSKCDDHHYRDGGDDMPRCSK